MGCRYSQPDDPANLPVESFNYKKKRSTKLKNSRKKESTKSKCDQNRSDRKCDQASKISQSTQANASNSSKDFPSTPGAVNTNKNTNNERVNMFGNQTSIQNVLNFSVDMPESGELESKVGNRHVFPIWNSNYSDSCACVNLDLNDASNASVTPVTDNHLRHSSGTSNTATLCHGCSQAIIGLQNNKKPVSNKTSSPNPDVNKTVEDVKADDTSGDVSSSMFSEPKQNQIAAIANLLALAALDLSAPASSLLVKNRKNAWIQLAGHPGAFAPAGPKTIWKKRIVKENYETLAYQALSEYPNCRDIMPMFYREVEYNKEYFIEMEDLLHHFHDPNIMDIKMGARTFLEAEVKNPVLRSDLFDKMVKLDPNAPTEEERKQKAITKLRYMQFREQESSTASSGFRIEAIRMSGEPPNTNLKKVCTREEVSYFIETFTKGHSAILPKLHQRLTDIKEKFESIPFFKSHEIIGSSLLIMFDRLNNANVWMIDFAKTIPVPDLTLNHRSPWKLGNHEDGYLFGLENLIEIFGELAEKEVKTQLNNVDVDS